MRPIDADRVLIAIDEYADNEDLFPDEIEALKKFVNQAPTLHAERKEEMVIKTLCNALIGLLTAECYPLTDNQSKAVMAAFGNVLGAIREEMGDNEIWTE